MTVPPAPAVKLTFEVVDTADSQTPAAWRLVQALRAASERAAIDVTPQGLVTAIIGSAAEAVAIARAVTGWLRESPSGTRVTVTALGQQTVLVGSQLDERSEQRLADALVSRFRGAGGAVAGLQVPRPAERDPTKSSKSLTS
jgi:hypothetical protein